jgi:hypothetical protein
MTKSQVEILEGSRPKPTIKPMITYYIFVGETFERRVKMV